MLPIDTMVLEYLRKKRGRIADIARANNLNPKSVWNAIQRLSAQGLIKKDEFDVYEITDIGEQSLKQVQSDSESRKRVLLTQLSRKIQDVSEKDLKEILKKIDENEQTRD